MATTQEIISFYKDCFEEENKGGGIANFLQAKVQHHTLIKGKEEHLSGLLPYTPIEEKLAKKIQTEVALYQKEKELIYGSHFLLGKYIGFQGKSAKLIAPLLIYPAEIIAENELYFIRAELSSPSINPVILDLLKSNNSEFDETNFYKQIPYSSITSSENGKLSRLIDKNLAVADTTQMVDYPNNLSSYKINKLFKTNSFDNSYQLVPCSGFGIVKKSTKTRSTIAELNTLSSKETSLSEPINCLFDSKYKQKIFFSNTDINPISTLSDAQENILCTAATHKISMAFGPPGTGKSFTIANLAISMMSKGESVLICSRNDGAVNVIEKKITQLLDGRKVCVKGGKREEIKALKDRLQFLLSRGHIKESNRYNRENSKVNQFFNKEKRINSLREQIKSFSKRFEDADIDELSTGEAIIKYDASNELWNRIFRYFLGRRVSTFKDDMLWNMTDLYLELNQKFIDTTKEHIYFTYEKTLHNTIGYNRDLLKNYLKSLRATNASRQKQFLESIDLQKLFKVFPIWLTNTKDVGEILPLKKELFDLVIIDEASQCDVPTCLPLLQRAKRAIIVGDPKQLSHISFLSKTKQHFLQEKYNFSPEQMDVFTHRDKSILDLTENSIKDQDQSNFLDEHFRSNPDIIAFSNKSFYFNELKVMTDNPKNRTQSLFHIRVNGNRDKNGINQKEINYILQQVKNLLEEDKDKVADQKRTIGILSPFRSQTDQIILNLQEELNIAEIENHQLLVGTAHSFQGEERDVMFLSFALDNDAHASAFRFLNQEDVFNVSITRAKNQQYIITSFDTNGISSDQLIRQYLDSLTGKNQKIEQQSEKDIFAKEVCDYIEGLQLSVKVDFPIAGVNIDLVIEQKGEVYGIDLVGYPGPFEGTIALYQYKSLQRAGVHLIPLPYSLWRFKRELCEEKIQTFLMVKEPLKIQ